MRKLLLLTFMGMVGLGEARAQTCGTTISTFPHIQDFQSSTVGAPGVLPTGWTTSPATGFRYEIEDGQPTSGTTSGPSADHTTGNPTTGKYVYTESSSGATGDIAYLVSPCINLAGLATPGFDFWYHMHGATTGTMEAQVSADNGATWTTLTTLTGAQQTSNTAPWLKKTVSLGAYTGTVQIRFKGTRGTSFTGDMAIDDVKFYNIPANDLELVAITAPIASGCGFTANETVTITIKNNGTTATTSFPVSYQIGAATPVQETANLVIAPGATATYSFTTKANLGTVGIYNFTAKTLLSTDGDPSNDTKTKTVTVIPTVATFPYFQNFESGAGGWVASGTNNTWALGTPAKPVIIGAASGTNAWVTNLTGQYNASENSQVLGPCFNFSTLIAPIFEMKIWWNSEFSWDGAVLQSSIDGGVTWQKVGAFGDPNNWYTDNTVNGAPGGQPAATAEAWTGRASSNNGSGGYVLAKHVLTGLGNQSSVLLRIAFGSDPSVQDDGIAFDDIRIYDTPANDAGVTAVVAPTTPVAPGVSVPVQVTVKNFGTSNLTSATLGFSVDGTTIVNNFAFNGNLALNASSTPVTIGNFTFSAGVHTLKAWSRLPNGQTDGNNGNDTTVVTLIACNPLAGNYTINKINPPSATNFTSVVSAAQALNSCGISGPVTFTVASGSGPYTGQVELTAITGASATNTITFEGNGNTVTAIPTSTNPPLIKLNGADFVKFNNFVLTVDPTATAGWGVQLMNSADNNTISNSTINLPLTSTSTSFNGIVAGSATTTSGTNTNGSKFQNNTINGGYYTININGSTTTPALNNEISGNTIKDSYIYNIYLNNTEGTLVQGNDISRPTRSTVTTFYGLFATGTNKSMVISKNRIHNAFGGAPSNTNTAYGIYLSSTDAPVGSENIIKNNLIYDINTNGTIYALYNVGSDGAHYYHNTINLNNANNTGTERGFFQTTAATNIKFVNNIVVINSGATGTKNALYFGTTTSTIISNNNDLFVNPTAANHNVGFYSTNFATLANWKTANSGAYDQNSVSADPQYVNLATGNLQPTSGILNNIGQQTPVTDDITGAIRNTTNPDPGAYEFTPSNNDVGVTAITSPNSGCGLSAAENIVVTIQNFGTTAQTNIPLSYTINAGTPVPHTFAGPLNPGASATVTFSTPANLGTPNTYTIVARTNLVGDALPGNDASTKTVVAIPSISTLPYTEGFESGNGGWIAGGIASSWALGTPAKAVINSAGTGTKSWVTNLTGQYNSSENSYVVGPCFNFSGKPDPDFEMKAWWNSEFSWDGAVLQSSIDGGATWQKVGAFGDPNNWYTDNTVNGAPGGQPAATAEAWTGRASSNNGSNGWVKVKHKLTGLGGKSSVQLRIAFGADPSVQDDGFAFDDIRIGDNTNNLAANSITPLTKLCGFGTNEPITVQLENLGSVPASGFTVTYNITGAATATVTQPFTGSLAASTTTNFTFTQGANFSAPGSYTVTVTVNMAGDPETANNTTTYTFSNATFTGMPPVFNFEPTGSGVAQLRTVTKPKSAIVESTDASSPLTAGSTKGMIMDGVDNAAWMTPVGVTDPWVNNMDNFSAAYICFNPSGGSATDSLWLTFDLKQLFKLANANTNFRVTVNGTQLGATYRPPFDPTNPATPIAWKRYKVDLYQFRNQGGIQIGLESSVKEAFAAGAGTANLVDNIRIVRRLISGTKADVLASKLHVFPNPSTGNFNVSLENGKAYSLEVTDLAGKTIMQQTAKGDTQLKLENQAKGIYLLKVNSEGKTTVRKLIVE